MLSKYIYLLLLLIPGPFLMAQELSLQQQADKTDSLTFYNNFSAAEKEADRLYDQLPKNKTRPDEKELALRLLLHKAYICARRMQTGKTLKISFDIIDQAKKYNLPEKEYQACLMAATMYELSNELDVCKSYLDKAGELYKEYGLEKVYSVYCIRLASYYRFTNQKDSAIYYAHKGMDYAIQYQNRREYTDACLLLGGLLSDRDFQEAIKYSSLAAAAFLNKHDYEGAAAMYNNIAAAYLRHKKTGMAFQYSDSALWVFKTNSLPEDAHFFRIRHRLFDTTGNRDSAYLYFQKYHNARVAELAGQEAAEIKKVTEQYQNHQKEIVIKSKNQQIIFIVSLLAIIVIAAILLVRKNRKINTQHKIISKQVEELMKMLEQKQVLLSELQHRVKNNLQHVISILEIQKESVGFNNIEELIRGNQNRIHSMALLHKKLTISENVNDVDLNRYITELAELVKASYNSHLKKVVLNISCEIKTIAIEKALPVGLIVVELVSNSMKHAFDRQSEGVITIELSQKTDTPEHKLYYADNGCGFNFNKKSEKGLGMEIIRGLIEQLDATVENSAGNGFKLTLSFQ